MLKELSTRLNLIPRSVMIAVLLIAAFLFWKENRGKVTKKFWDLLKYETWVVLFLLYAALLFTGTILARPHTKPSCVIGVFGLFDKKGKLNSDGIENILMFIPYTFFWLMAFRPDQLVLKCLLLSIATTVFIELSQLLFSLGEFSLADLVHNIIGGMIGCGIWYFCKTIKQLLCHKVK